MPDHPPSQNGAPTAAAHGWEEAAPAAPCPVCGAAEGCRTRRHTVACLHRGGPLAEEKVGGTSGRTYFAHPRDPATGRPFEPVPDATRQFFEVLFEPTDVVLVRPVEGWAEGGRRRSRVLFAATRYPTAGDLAADFRAWGRLAELSRAERANVYFGVCPRHGAGHFDLARQVRTVRTLWADLDHCSVEEAARRCESAGLPAPTATVCSGHGVHLYWKLAEPARIDAPAPPAVYKEFVTQASGKKKPRPYWAEPGTKARVYDLPSTLSPDAARLQRVLAGVAAAVGGDHTQDLSRLLRVPGTLNRKDERNGTPPVPCEVVACDPDRVYPLAAFERFAAERSPPEPPGPSPAAVRLPTGRTLTASRRNRLAALLNASAVSAVGSRSGADFAALAYAVETGLDADAVWAEAQGVGKFAERGREYFDRTWAKAEEKVRGAVYARACRAAGVGTGAGARTPGPAPPEGPDTPPPVGDPDAGPNESPDDPHRLARLLRGSNADPRGDTWRFYRDEVWEWTGRRWKAVPDAEMRCRAAAFCKRALDDDHLRAAGSDESATVPKVSRELVANALQALGGMVLVPREVPQPCWLADAAPEPRPLIAVANGLLDVEALLAGRDGVLAPHDPRWFSPVCLPYPFDPAADCPAWHGVLARNLGDDPGKARLLRQWAGYLLLPDTGQQRFLMMTGEGANGKSVVCAGIRGLLGEDNVSAVGLELFGDKFHLAETLGKLANIVPEVGELDRIAGCLWRLRRVVAYETALSAAGMEEAADGPAEPDEATSLPPVVTDRTRLKKAEKKLATARTDLDAWGATAAAFDAVAAGADDTPLTGDAVEGVFSDVNGAVPDPERQWFEFEGAKFLAGLGLPPEFVPCWTEWPGWTVGIVRAAVTAAAAELNVPPDFLLTRARADRSEWMEHQRAGVRGLEAEARRLADRIEMRRGRAVVRRVIPDAPALDKVTRYEAHLTRQMLQALHTLERLQANRAGQPVAPRWRSTCLWTGCPRPAGDGGFVSQNGPPGDGRAGTTIPEKPREGRRWAGSGAAGGGGTGRRRRWRRAGRSTSPP